MQKNRERKKIVREEVGSRQIMSIGASMSRVRFVPKQSADIRVHQALPQHLLRLLLAFASAS